MAERKKNLREELILAGIDEINTYGANNFSVRRVAQACHVSSAAPYKHFKDKKEFISAIIDYVNDQWAISQEEALRSCDQDVKSLMVEAAIRYVQFLMENPYYRQILMMKNADFDNLYHRKRGEINSRTEGIMEQVRTHYGLSDEVWRRKTLMFRSLIFGSVFMFDCGEFTYTEETLNDLRFIFNREFEIF